MVRVDYATVERMRDAKSPNTPHRWRKKGCDNLEQDGWCRGRSTGKAGLRFPVGYILVVMTPRHDRYLLILSAIFLIQWVWLAIDPHDRSDWALENSARSQP